MATFDARAWRIPTLTVLFGLMFWDATRIWMPSILFVVGDAGSTPATTLGAIALGTAVVPVIAVLLLRDATPRLAWIAGAGGLLLGRLVLVVADGGRAQFVGATMSIIAALLALAALTWSRPHDGILRIAWLSGIAISTGLHAIQGGIDALWRDHAFASLWSLLLVVAAVSIVRDIGATLDDNRPPGHDQRRRSRDDTGTDTHATSIWPWVGIGAASALFGILVAPAGRIAIATGWSDRVVVVVIVAIVGTMVMAAVAARSIGARICGPLAATAITLGAIAALRPLSTAAVVGQVSLAIGIGLLAGMTAPRRRRSRRHSNLSAPHASSSSDSGPGGALTRERRRQARASASSLLAFSVVGFAYYAPYDMRLAYPSRAVLLVTAIALAVAALTTTRAGASTTVRSTFARPLPFVAGLTAIAALTGAGVSPGERDEPIGQDTERVRVVLYNLHMGFDTLGRLSIDRLTETLVGVDPDIIVLNEVDRGWMTTGARDDLRIIERAVALDSRFAPAADDVWGNALMSRWPIVDFRFDRLPRGRDAMARSMFTGTLRRPGDERELAVIGAHLSHVDQQGDTRMPQARAMAGEVARLRERGLAVIVAGDLNAEPGSQELLTFGEFVRSAVPPGHPTWPSWDPAVQIDHILISPELEVIDWHYLDSQDSDHVGIVVDLRWPRA